MSAKSLAETEIRSGMKKILDPNDNPLKEGGISSQQHPFMSGKSGQVSMCRWEDSGKKATNWKVEFSIYGGKQITVNLGKFRIYCEHLQLSLKDLQEAAQQLLILRHYLVSVASAPAAASAEATAASFLARLDIISSKFVTLVDRLKAAFAYYESAEKAAKNSFTGDYRVVADAVWQGFFTANTLVNYAFGVYNGTDTPVTNLTLISFLLEQTLNRKSYDLQVTPIIGTKLTGQNVPLNSAALLAHYGPVYPRNPEEGMLRVSEYRKKSGGRAWLVEIPGTQNWGINTTSPHDLSTNFRTNAGLSSDLNTAVTEALKQAGYREGEPLELVGHSQGAAVATALAGNRAFMKKHNVVSVLATGGNIGAVKPLGNAHVLAFERDTDIVPRLDGRNNAKVQNLTTVVGKIDKVEGIKARHSRPRYLLLAQEAEKQKLYEVQKWNEYRLAKLGIDEHTEMVSRDYQILRKYR